MARTKAMIACTISGGRLGPASMTSHSDSAYRPFPTTGNPQFPSVFAQAVY
jgi:hypothetical protein